MVYNSINKLNFYHISLSLITEVLITAEYVLSKYYINPSMLCTAICIYATHVFQNP